MQENPPAGKRRCDECNKFIGISNFATHVKRVHPEKVHELCPRVIQPQVTLVLAQAASLHALDEQDGAVHEELGDVVLSDPSDAEAEDQVPTVRHKLLQFVNNVGAYVSVAQSCEVGTHATCVFVTHGYASRQIVTSTGMQTVSVRRMQCKTHKKFQREINSRSTRAAELAGFRLSEECFEIRKVLYAGAFLMLIATQFIITGSVTNVARLVAATHGAEEFAFEY